MKFTDLRDIVTFEDRFSDTEWVDIYRLRFKQRGFFESNSDFSWVKIHGVEFDLEIRQAKIVEVLYNEHIHENGNAKGILFHTIVERAFKNLPKKLQPAENISDFRMNNYFKDRKKSSRPSFQHLIYSTGDGKFRLNL